MWRMHSMRKMKERIGSFSCFFWTLCEKQFSFGPMRNQWAQARIPSRSRSWWLMLVWNLQCLLFRLGVLVSTGKDSHRKTEMLPMQPLLSPALLQCVSSSSHQHEQV
jgi:hypothetical protein